MASSQPKLLTKSDKPRSQGDAPPIPAPKSKAALQAAPQASKYELVSSTWELQSGGLAGVLSADETDFLVVGVLGGSGLGKSSFLNALLGLREGVPGTCPPFRVGRLEQHLSGQHCSSGIELRVSPDAAVVGLDTQPLFSLSVLGELARWERPSLPLATPAVAAASVTKSNVVPYEAAQRLMELQQGVLLLSVCHLVVVLCDGLHDELAWEYLRDVEMLARGVPDPTLPQLPQPPAGAAGAGSAPGPKPPQQPQHTHLADVLLLHVLPGGEVHQHQQQPGSSSWLGGGGDLPSLAAIQDLERRAQSYFGPSRFNQPGPISLADFLQRGGPSSGTSTSASSAGGRAGSRLSCWAAPHPALPAGTCAGEAWLQALLHRLLCYPRAAFARRASQAAWGAGVRGAWEALVRSPDILEFYTRLVGTLYKGAGGWGLAR